ncbi:M48 family metallopeptidase [Methanobrevibacter sp.]|uniref:M48 family metallopeptidase n=1 Tax=Methanobrevibacter sp. TaxID=66852 RepID=UPI0025FAA12E|nr:SprT family zinc-dependent metalloprotease [Methanobrevibacter sp.]MBQ2831910.1 M48 family metallopeptidase [Methanobrevibacter sp.]
MKKETKIIENIAIILHRKNIKNMYIRILPPDGEVRVSAPSFVSDEEIENFIKARKDWILKKQKLIQDNNIQGPLKYKNGEKHYLWGKEYQMQLISNEAVKNAFADENKSVIYLPVPKRSTIEKRKQILTEFYRSQMKIAIPPILEKCMKIVGKAPSEVKIRNMKNWGNCRYQDKKITLNLNLAKKDPICLEYVIIHELCHLIEFNHGKKFKKLMDQYCPDWKKIKKILNE